jgi:dimethylamine/trimethylamine dehydrogenase
MGEEWRRGWHPETIAPRRSDAEVLVVGGGPAGLECARALGQRGYRVALAEAERELGGRVRREARLPGLAEWRRVIDWRLTQIGKLPNVALYPGSPMRADDILEAGYEHVIVATGATWRRDGVGRHQWRPIPGHGQPHVLTPDDILAGRRPAGRVLIYDDDHFYIGGALAELLAAQGCAVTLATPAPLVSYWTQHTLEQERIHRRLLGLGVELRTQQILRAIESESATLAATVSGQEAALACDAVVLVADRLPNDALFHELRPALAEGQLRSLRLIGDAEAPHIIAQAVFAGHLAAREFEECPVEETPFRVERAPFE